MRRMGLTSLGQIIFESVGVDVLQFLCRSAVCKEQLLKRCPCLCVRLDMCVERRCRQNRLGSPPRRAASLLPLLTVGAVLLDLLANPRWVMSRRVTPGDARHKAGKPSRAHHVMWCHAAAAALRSVRPGRMADGHWKLRL